MGNQSIGILPFLLESVLKEHTFHPGLIFDLPIIDCIGVRISSVVLIVSIFSVPAFLLLLTLVWS